MAAALHAHALLVIPPLLKPGAGPLFGPALLVAAARAAGHDAEVLDPSIRRIRAPRSTTKASRPGRAK